MSDAHLYTPGPWAYDDESGQIVVRDGAPREDMSLLASAVLADVRPTIDGYQGHHNGLLMAAAPELLQALEALYREAKKHGELIDSETMERAYRAIVKARGAA